MAVTNYYTVNGEIIGEKVGAGARTDYLTDALGSVTATMNQSAQVVNTYRYKPYGALLAKTGVGADPAFQWVGSQGYRQTSKRYSDVYIRARHYDTNTARWASKDSLWPAQLAYIYVGNKPLTAIDPSGYLPASSCCCCPRSLEITNIQPSKSSGTPPKQNTDACKIGPKFGWPLPSIWHGVFFQVKYEHDWVSIPMGKPSGDCQLSWRENVELTRNGERQPPVDTNGKWVERNVDGSLVYEQWRQRTSPKPPNCKGGTKCDLTDPPGINAVSGSDTYLRGEIHIAITPHDNCKKVCPPPPAPIDASVLVSARGTHIDICQVTIGGKTYRCS